MLIQKRITGYNGGFVSDSEYQCDMCHKPLKKQERILISTSEIGKDKPIKKWDLCENCMKIIEKNVKIWYGKIVNKK